MSIEIMIDKGEAHIEGTIVMIRDKAVSQEDFNKVVHRVATQSEMPIDGQKSSRSRGFNVIIVVNSDIWQKNAMADRDNNGLTLETHRVEEVTIMCAETMSTIKERSSAITVISLDT